MINLIIFDLDGVLVDTEELHYESLLYCISKITTLPAWAIKTVVHQDGTTTKHKLSELQKTFGTSTDDLNKIDNAKQELVLEKLKKLTPNKNQIKMLKEIELLIPILAIGSNSRKENVEIILDALQIREFFSYVVTANDVQHGKPDPELFKKIMTVAGCEPANTLILEDSPAGKSAAISSGANLLPISNVSETTLGYIQDALHKYDSYNSGSNGRTGFPIR